MRGSRSGNLAGPWCGRWFFKFPNEAMKFGVACDLQLSFAFAVTVIFISIVLFRVMI